MATAMVEVQSVKQLGELLEKAKRSLVVIYFCASWSPQYTQMTEVMIELAKQHPQVTFVKLEAEALPEVSEKYEISSVPTFLFIKNHEKIDRIDGAHAPDLTKKVQRYSETAKQDLNDHLKKLINSAPCILFMKGIPQDPRCGFSRQIIGIFSEHNIRYSSFDILSDEDVRQGLKNYSNWPTYPQLYVNGELVGGLDIVKELAESGELDKICPKEMGLEHRLKTLINKSRVILFMKGSKEMAKCGFSRAIIGILNEIGIDFETFDVLGDEQVRQGLKTYSNWPTYPQLYVKGELIGGLDIVKVHYAMHAILDVIQLASGTLKSDFFIIGILWIRTATLSCIQCLGMTFRCERHYRNELKESGELHSVLKGETNS